MIDESEIRLATQVAVSFCCCFCFDMCVCVRACVRACVCTCVRTCVRVAVVTVTGLDNAWASFCKQRRHSQEDRTPTYWDPVHVAAGQEVAFDTLPVLSAHGLQH